MANQFRVGASLALALGDPLRESRPYAKMPSAATHAST